MKRYSSPFLNILPSLDVHGHTRETVIYPVSDFINDNIKLRNNKIVIIHGIGEGILKKAVHDSLKRNKKVESYNVDVINTGSTLVKLKENV